MQLHPNYSQSILRQREFKIVKIKDQFHLQREIIEIIIIFFRNVQESSSTEPLSQKSLNSCGSIFR